MFYKDGKEVDRLVGLQHPETIDECIKMILWSFLWFCIDQDSKGWFKEIEEK